MSIPMRRSAPNSFRLTEGHAERFCGAGPLPAAGATRLLSSSADTRSCTLFLKPLD